MDHDADGRMEGLILLSLRPPPAPHPPPPDIPLFWNASLQSPSCHPPTSMHCQPAKLTELHGLEWHREAGATPCATLPYSINCRCALKHVYKTRNQHKCILGLCSQSFEGGNAHKYNFSRNNRSCFLLGFSPLFWVSFFLRTLYSLDRVCGIFNQQAQQIFFSVCLFLLLQSIWTFSLRFIARLTVALN